jgi:hypothetical protein
MATAIEQLVNQLYQQQLGREADVGGAAYFAGRLASGATESQVAKEMAQSLEGQNLLTQAITSSYRENLARNPEQQGYQYWQSAAQDQGLSAKQVKDLVSNAAVAEQVQRGISGGFTNMELAALEADPYGGRYATQSIYDLPQDAVNVSTIGNRQAQFVNPITQQAVISNFERLYGDYSATPGQDVLSNPVVNATLQRALNSGALNQAGYNSIVSGLTNATNMDQVRNIFATPQAQVVIDAIYGQQTGEDVNLQTAQAEAAQRQAVLNATDQGYYQNNMQLADAYRAAGLDFPFGQEAYQGYNTMMRQGDVVTPTNFNERVNSLLQSISGQFGGTNAMQTPQSGQYYSEAGLQPGFTPFGTEGTTFRSGVAGYIPQAQLPTRFDFGAPPVNTTFQQYRPGAFQPEGVKTGGFITGYNADGTPIFSTYSNPAVNVGGAVAPTTPVTTPVTPVTQYYTSPTGQLYASQEAYQNYLSQNQG